MENVKRYNCVSGEGMVVNGSGFWVSSKDYLDLLNKYNRALNIPPVVLSTESKEKLVHIKDLKGGEIIVEEYNGYTVTVDTPVVMERLDNKNRVDYTVMATNEIGQKCKIYGYDEDTCDYTTVAEIKIK